MTSTQPAVRRRPVRLLLVVGLLLVAALAVVLVVGRDPATPTGPTGRSVVEGVLAEEPEASVVLPVDVPPGYVLAGGDTASGADGEEPVTAWVFRPVQQESGLAVLQVCVAAPARCAAVDDGVLLREVDGLEVSLVPFGPEEGLARTLELWGEASLTRDWQSLDWIDEPLGPAPG